MRAKASRSTTRVRPTARRFSTSFLDEAAKNKIVWIRAGKRTDHRFIGIWAVVVRGRVFARSWTLKPEGWYHTFLRDPVGRLRVGDREVPIRAVRVRSEGMRDAVERAYADKYDTPGSLKYVRGFRTPRRREATMEFRPR